MDLTYAVKQLDREIAHAEQQLSEKKVTRKSLFSALGPEEKKSVETEARKLHAELRGEKPPPPLGL